MARLRQAQIADFTSLLVAGIAAAMAPLQVFLLAFAVLGPFHYLTEIAWLRKKDFYFSDGLVSPGRFAALASLLALMATADALLGRGLSFFFVGAALVLALSIWIRNVWVILAIAVAGYAATKFLHSGKFFLAFLVPTIIHVFVFTWIFMLSGALRSKKNWLTWTNCALMLLIPVALLRLHLHYAAPGAAWVHREAVSFGPLHVYLAKLMGHTMALNGTMLADPLVAAMMRFTAFAYFFHYLNWFAKTELLQWHKVSGRMWAAIGAMYAVSVGLYAWNFVVGFAVVSVLSLGHVLLEFPLNWHSMRFVGRRLLGMKDEPKQPPAGKVATAVAR